ncbi:MAG: hypothetical protein Q4E55_03125 [Bacteroidales bacterium]|nr:hypothetical protein [Bacteroidales bacterium]
MGTKDREELVSEWKQETNSWNKIINEDFSRNQLLKDTLKVLTKDLEPKKWLSIAKVLIEKEIFTHLDEVKKTCDMNSGRAMRHIGIEGAAKTIGQRMSPVSRGIEKDVNTKFTEDVENLLDFLLSMQSNKEYSSLDNGNRLTDAPETFSFMSTNPNIAFVEEGTITLPSTRDRKDGTCIILSKNKQNEGKYYRVRVENGQIYDESKQPTIDRLMGRTMGYCLTLVKQLIPEYNDEKQKAENMESMINQLLTCALPREKDVIIELTKAVDRLAKSGNRLDANANNPDFRVGVREGKQIADEELDSWLLLEPFPGAV